MDEKILNERTERALEEMGEKYDTSVGSWSRDILRGAVIINMELEDSFKEFVRERYSGDIKDKVLLDMVCADDDIEREPAKKSIGKVTIVGEIGAQIVAGYKAIRSKDGVEFIIKEDSIILNNSTKVEVECCSTGIVGNSNAGEIDSFADEYPGLISITNEDPISNGAEEESNRELNQRRNRTLIRPKHFENRYWYEDEVLNVTGVEMSKCVPKHNGKGTVKVVIAGIEGEPVTPEIVTAAHDYLDSKILSDVAITVESISNNELDITFTGEIHQDYTKQKAEEEVKKKVQEYFNAAVFETSKIYYHYISDIILRGCNSIVKFSNLLVNDGKDDISISESERLKIRNLSITEETNG